MFQVTLMNKQKIIYNILLLWHSRLKCKRRHLFKMLENKCFPLQIKRDLLNIASHQLCKLRNFNPAGLTLQLYYKLMSEIALVCSRNIMPPGTPAILNYALYLTAQGVQDSLDKKKQTNTRQNLKTIKSCPFDKNSIKDILVVCSYYDILPLLISLMDEKLMRNASYEILTAHTAIIRQKGSTACCTNIILLLLCHGIYVMKNLLPKRKSNVQNILSLYLNSYSPSTKCSTFCGNTSKIHFVENHIIPDYQNGQFEKNVFTRVGVATNESNGGAKLICFESPVKNYQRLAASNKTFQINDICARMLFSYPLPGGTSYQNTLIQF
jgi:hypothetical protein